MRTFRLFRRKNVLKINSYFTASSKNILVGTACLMMSPEPGGEEEKKGERRPEGRRSSEQLPFETPGVSNHMVSCFATHKGKTL